MPIEPVKAYLLGILPDSEAARLEAKYFADSSFLGMLEKKEEDLIEDYLEGRLSSWEKERFEERYGAVPLLKQKVDTIKRRRQAVRVKQHSWMWRALAGAAACSVAFAMFWLSLERTQDKSGMQVRQNPSSEQMLVTLNVAPGVQRSVGELPNVTLPENAALSLVLEIPGARTPAAYNAHVLRLEDTGASVPMWTSPAAIQSQPSATGQNVMFRIEASLLAPNDYVVELTTKDAEIVERYLFRINRRIPGL